VVHGWGLVSDPSFSRWIPRVHSAECSMVKGEILETRNILGLKAGVVKVESVPVRTGMIWM
jgi:hypothetical protein